MGEKHQVKNHKRFSRGLDYILSLSIACAIGAVVQYFFFMPPRIITFDIKATTTTFLKQVATLNIDENQKSVMVKRYNKSLTEVVKDYEAQNYIILVKNAVVSNVEDKTNEIQQKIAQKMKERKRD